MEIKIKKADIKMEIFGIVLVAFVVGFVIGRREKGIAKGSEAGESGEVSVSRQGYDGKSIASPVDGKLHFLCESGRKCVIIEPNQGKVYAPLSGKIVKLYPMGNAFRLRDNEGTELLIRVGRAQPDELCSMYFRTRIVENEIINKGKLLLEFDREGLLGAGEDIGVTVCPETDWESEIFISEIESVKVGEEIFRIGEKV